MTSPLNRAQIEIFTFKEGLLSRVAHDLRIHVEAFEVSLVDDRIDARFDPASLRVDGAMRKNTLAPGVLDAADRRKIEDTIRDDVLGTRRYPEIRFEGRVDPSTRPLRIEGHLELVGQRRPVSLTLSPVVLGTGRWLRGRTTLVPSRWGIRPYRALAGALKLQDRVEVQVQAQDEPDPEAATVTERRWTVDGRPFTAS